jgi:hypothetical protein
MGKTSKKVAVASRSKDATKLTDRIQDLHLDPRGDGMYSGTFRWLETKQFPPLPQPSNTCDAALTNGWEGFLRSRSSESASYVEIAKNDPSCLDALSFPVTFLHVASTLKLLGDSDTHHHVVVLGATRKAEQRVWLITDYWFEITYYFPSKEITLWFVGPEADADCPHRKPSQPTNLLAVHHVQGTFTDFVNHPEATGCTPHNTVLIGYNTGFGNFVESGKFDLLFSWLPDLYAITNAGFPAIFTCANDYADMNGEFAVQSRVLGAKMLLLPQQNPFSMASHLHEDGKKYTAWSRGNSFLYAVQGSDPARRVALKSGDFVSLQNRLDASLDLHIEDALGRHFYKGMVLSKEQASRCKVLQRSRSSSFSSPPPSKVQARPRSSSASVSLKTPTFEIHPGPRPQAVVILIHVPGVDASHRIAVDVSDNSLSLLIPDKYALRASLPFQVENNAPVRAQLTPPFLSISCLRQTN